MNDQHYTPGLSPALARRYKSYPRRWNGQVPRRVRVLYTVTPREPEQFAPGTAAIEGQTYDCYVTSEGALFAILEHGEILWLGLGQCEVVEFHPRVEKPEPIHYHRKSKRKDPAGTPGGPVTAPAREPLICDCGCGRAIQDHMDRVEAWPWVYRVGCPQVVKGSEERNG